jgi:hypothetical protein
MLLELIVEIITCPVLAISGRSMEYSVENCNIEINVDMLSEDKTDHVLEELKFDISTLECDAQPEIGPILAESPSNSNVFQSMIILLKSIIDAFQWASALIMDHASQSSLISQSIRTTEAIFSKLYGLIQTTCYSKHVEDDLRETLLRCIPISVAEYDSVYHCSFDSSPSFITGSLLEIRNKAPWTLIENISSGMISNSIWESSRPISRQLFY